MYVEGNRDNRAVRVWDLAVRLFHWSLVGLVAAAWISNSLNRMDWHGRIGYAVLTLVLFRLVWGFVGGSHARFAAFLRGPGTVLRYGRDFFAHRAAKVVGHNPLGGWMVIALLLALLAQGSLGLFATDDIVFEGPLNHLVSSRTASLLTTLHKLGFNLILALVAVHVLGVVAHLVVERDNLVRPMFTGIKHLPATLGAEDARGGSPLLALLVLAGAAGVVWAVITLTR